MMNGVHNQHVLLIMRVLRANFDVIQVLVEHGNSCDIMYIDVFYTLQLTNKNLMSYKSYDLEGFNDSTIKP